MPYVEFIEACSMQHGHRRRFRYAAPVHLRGSPYDLDSKKGFQMTRPNARGPRVFESQANNSAPLYGTAHIARIASSILYGVRRQGRVKNIKC
jgi:hypothetical protein